MADRLRSFLLGRMALAAMVFAGLIFLGAAPRACADDCQKRIQRADHDLHKAARKYGWDSPEAAHERHELMEAREWCWEHHHHWWDEDGRRWHDNRDWDDHDHDRDHDRH
jgi:hypothetical protein